MAYSKIALKIIKMQVMMKVSIAFSFVRPDDGELDLTLLKTLIVTRKMITSRDILPGITFGSIMKLIQETITNRQHGM